jgi:Tfp pilus assembly PilM family ATPase
MKSPFQKQIIAAVTPSLESLLKEIRRTIRYYEHRYPKEQTIGQIVTMGSSTSIPGLTGFLSELLHIPARNFDPATYIDFEHLPSFYTADHMAYVTAAGLAIIDPAEIFR